MVVEVEQIRANWADLTPKNMFCKFGYYHHDYSIPVYGLILQSPKDSVGLSDRDPSRLFLDI